MDRSRMIQPNLLPQRQHPQIPHDQQTTGAGEAGSLLLPESMGKTRRRHTEDEWEAIRPDLTELLLSHNLEDAAQIIKQTHNFEASVRAYRDKINVWGLKQHQSAKELGVVVAKRDKRKREEGKNTVILARGVQLATERLDLFERRAKYKQSASAATPQSYEYYTPANNGLTPNAVQTPAGLRSSLLLGSQDDTANHNEHKDLCKKLLMFDQMTEPMVVLEPRRPIEPTTENETESVEWTARKTTTSQSPHLETVKVQMTPGTQIEALRTESQVPERPTHDMHQVGHIAIVGRGRFAKKEKPLRLLWQMKKLARDMNRALHLPTISGKATLPGPQATAGECISYIVRVRGKIAEIKEKQQRMISFCQQDNYIQSVLGLTKQDRVRWLQSWSETVEDDTSLIVQTADHLFGDLTVSYPEMDILEILVYLYTTSPRQEPIILRAAAGWDTREQHRDCLYCENTFQIVDFMGSSGAVKLHISNSNSIEMLEPFSTFESFRNAFTRSQKTVYTSWSEVAYMFQGWTYVPLLRRCPCQSKAHKNQSSEHYINVFDEQMIELEDFDPAASSYLKVPFEPFPSSEDGKVMMYGSKGRIHPSEETWDPLGEEGSEEEFEPFPEAEHDSVSDSRAVKVIAQGDLECF